MGICQFGFNVGLPYRKPSMTNKVQNSKLVPLLSTKSTSVQTIPTMPRTPSPHERQKRHSDPAPLQTITEAMGRRLEPPTRVVKTASNISVPKSIPKSDRSSPIRFPDTTPVDTVIEVCKPRRESNVQSYSQIAFGVEVYPVKSSHEKTLSHTDAGSDEDRADHKLSNDFSTVVTSLPQMTLYQTYVYAKSLTPFRKLVGEIAFQVERRIVDFTFNDYQVMTRHETKQRKFDGYTLANLHTKIGERTSDDLGTVMLSYREILNERLEQLRLELSTINYDLLFHGEFGERLMNQFGISETPVDRFGDAYVLAYHMNKIIRDKTVLGHVLILIDALNYLSKIDGRNLLLW